MCPMYRRTSGNSRGVCDIFLVADSAAALGLMVPMVADGFCQMLTAYESTNWRRLVTGGLFGYALYTLFAHSSVWVFLLGYHLSDAMK